MVFWLFYLLLSQDSEETFLQGSIYFDLQGLQAKDTPINCEEVV